MIRTLMISLMLLTGCGGDAPPPAAADVTAQEQIRAASQSNWWDALPRKEWSAFERIDTAQDWFEVYRVSTGVFAIYEPGQFEEVISFLILGEQRALLFDSGLGIGDMRTVVAKLTDLDVVVLNSHSHYDHIGGNHQFDTVYATGKDYSRRRSAGSTHADVAGFFAEGRVWKPLPDGIDTATFRSEPYAVTKTVTDGEVIDLGGRKLEVVMTPGHAPDALCLLDRENRALFTGDTFYLAPLYTHLKDSDFDAYAKSAAKLAALADAYDDAYTAHNVPVVDGHYLVALDAAFQAIQSGTTDEFTESDGLRQYFFDGFSIIANNERLQPGN